MIRIVACLLVLVTAVTAHADAAASRATDCQDVPGYFGRVDEAIVDGMAELIERLGFRDHFGPANEKTAEGGPGFLSLSPREREAIIAFMSLPGDVLGAMDEDEIPETFRDLHHSAARYWVHMGDMLEAVSDGAPSAAIPFFDRLDAATSDNHSAQQALIAACPDEVETYAGTSESLNASSDVFGDDLLTAWEDVDADDMAGIGYNFLFHATDEDVTDATPMASTSATGLAAP